MPHDRGWSLLVALIICCTLQKRDSVIDWWAVVYSRTVIVIQPIIIQSIQNNFKLETCFFVKFPSLKHLPFRRQFQDLKKSLSSRYLHTDCNSAAVAKTPLKKEFTLFETSWRWIQSHNLSNAGESWTCLGVEFLRPVYMEMRDPR